MPSFGRYELAAELVRRIRSEILGVPTKPTPRSSRSPVAGGAR
jgi:hypothetical protein